MIRNDRIFPFLWGFNDPLMRVDLSFIFFGHIDRDRFGFKILEQRDVSM